MRARWLGLCIGLAGSELLGLAYRVNPHGATAQDIAICLLVGVGGLGYLFGRLVEAVERIADKQGDAKATVRFVVESSLDEVAGLRVPDAPPEDL